MGTKLKLFDTLKYIEIETHSACTRCCPWCLFGAYPNLRPSGIEYLDTIYITNILYDLRRNNYSGAIGLYSINEPLMDERIISGELIRLCKEILGQHVVVTITTNGDLLTYKIANHLFAHGLDHMKISCYEKDRYKEMKRLFEKHFNISVTDQTRYWNGGFESNRAGALRKSRLFIPNSCYYPFYRSAIGWDGEIRICYNDFLNNIKIGNIKCYNFSDIMHTKENIEIRKNIRTNRHNFFPCCNCNINVPQKKMDDFNNKIKTYIEV